ncbi:MAG: class I SAM-dependent methyltransferase [Christensenellaceae bacterium]|jgi:23S rRNA (cytosine1962-C5)-methyltransferase|nr:class I SAM-dependent methyltransferase [Christensenellaceae bacterium]
MSESIRTNNEWINYAVLASGAGQKLENYNDILLLRPDPQIIWNAPYNLADTKGLSAIYENASSDGRGAWRMLLDVPPQFTIQWRDLIFSLRLTAFKHLGVFPEQAYNWARIIDLIKKAVVSGRTVKVLNLFAYTGGATLAAASAGAEVCHVDAAKAMCERAGYNASLSGLRKASIRYIVDDCIAFVEREIRRGHKYDGVIMDPPAYGRGPKGELWKIEDKVYGLVELTKRVLSDDPIFHLINSYASGLQPTAMSNVQRVALRDVKCRVEAYEIGIATQDEAIILPCGASSMALF